MADPAGNQIAAADVTTASESFNVEPTTAGNYTLSVRNMEGDQVQVLFTIGYYSGPASDSSEFWSTPLGSMTGAVLFGIGRIVAIIAGAIVFAIGRRKAGVLFLQWKTLRVYKIKMRNER